MSLVAFVNCAWLVIGSRAMCKMMDIVDIPLHDTLRFQRQHSSTAFTLQCLFLIERPKETNETSAFDCNMGLSFYKPVTKHALCFFNPTAGCNIILIHSCDYIESCVQNDRVKYLLTQSFCTQLFIWSQERMTAFSLSIFIQSATLLQPFPKTNHHSNTPKNKISTTQLWQISRSWLV